MPSPLVEKILADFSDSSGTELDLEKYWPAIFTDDDLVIVAQRLPRLATLNLTWCEVTDEGVMAVAGTLTQLTSLNLTGCQQVTDEGVMAVADTLTQLTALDLSHCAKVTDVGVRALAYKLPGLASLNLTICEQVTDVGVKAVADKLTGLTFLDLTYCAKVTDTGVKAVADKLTGLTSLNLAGCRQVTDVGAMAVANTLTRLASLDLSACDKVTDVGVKAVADKLTGLTSLHLYGCGKVTDAGVMAVADKLTGLTSLSLHNCRQVADAGVMAVADKLTGLTSLDLCGCDKVTDAGVKAVADKLTGLTSLNLENCHEVTDAGVMAAAAKLTRLDYLNVSNILSLRIPKELLGNPSNLAAIRAYYARGEREGNRQLNEAKLIVVGNEAVGKSALVNYLVEDRPCADSAKTEGVTILDRINIAKWDVEKSTTGEDPLRLNVWDFGGQEVLYETHRFFLTARSLYLIVLEARRENTGDAEAVLHDWMRAVRNRGGEEVPIIVVVNKAEAPHDLRLDEVRLLKDYPAIRAFVRTSCRDPKKVPEGGKNIAKLRRLIVEVVRRNLPHVCDWLPESYFRVKEEVGHLAREESMLSTARYATICTRAGITKESEQETLLALLDQIGVVVKHSLTTLLDPNWLTTAVYRILTHAGVVKDGGEFARDDIGRLLADLRYADRYPQKWWPYIADMMVLFNLCFELEDQPGRYLVPLQLPTQEPEVNWDEANSLRFRYDYDSLPMSILPRFIVEMHRHLTANRTAWVSGVVLALDGCKILVRADRRNRRTHVFVVGPKGEQRGALAVVRAAFAKVHKLYDELKITPMVPVSVAGNPDAAIEYEQLVEFERQGVAAYPYKGAEKPFLVKKLLEGVGADPQPYSGVTFQIGTLTGGITMAKYDTKVESSQIGAMATGDGATASSTGNLTQQHGMDGRTATQLATLLDELLGILKNVEVPTTVKPKLNETVTAVEEAKVIATSANPEKGKLSATFDKVKGWVNGALSVGMFAEEAAKKVGDLIGRVGGLLG